MVWRLKIRNFTRLWVNSGLSGKNADVKSARSLGKSGYVDELTKIE